MNESTDISTDLQCRIDRLVDGELPTDQRVALLAALDQDTAHWRTCALAFLEAQSLRESLATMQAGDVETHASQNAVRNDSILIHSSRKHWLLRGALAAAAIGLFFILGFAVGRMERSSDPNPMFVKHNQEDSGRHNAPMTGFSGSTPVAYVELPGHDGRTVRVPVVDDPDADTAWQQQAQIDIPDYMIQVMARKGYEIQREREMMAVALDDGRKVVIPVEKVRWSYVGHRVH